MHKKSQNKNDEMGRIEKNEFIRVKNHVGSDKRSKMNIAVCVLAY